MTRESYQKQAEINLRVMSRTANGFLDTSASADKKEKMAVADGEIARELAVRNFTDALDKAWENRYKVFGTPAELRAFIESLAGTVNRGLLRDGVLYRSGVDSAKYNYIPVEKVEASASWFYEHLFSLLCRETYDAAEAAAAAEYYINLTVHFFADGCSKCSMVIAAWLLMRGGHSLPVYPGRDEYYGFCSRFRGSPAGSKTDRKDFDAFLRYYRGLFTENVELREHEDLMTLILPNRFYAGNVESVEAQMDALLQAAQPRTIRMDAAEMDYISSVGLRVLLRLIDEYDNPVIFNVPEVVYEVLDVSGFTSLMRVDRRLKELSTEGCELIGRGMNGSVYRYAPDTIVKVYSERNQMEDVRREQQMSRFCFVSGLPTAIPLNLVRVGDRLGALYELLDAKSLTREFVEKPEEREELAEKYIDLMKKIHAIVPERQDLPKEITLPEKKNAFLGWALDLEEILDQETFEKLRRIIEGIPEGNTLLHGDLTPSNIMRENGKLILIDLDGIGTGDSVFDLANIAAGLKGFPDLRHNDIMGWGDAALREWVLERVLDGYFAELPEQEREEKKRLIMLCMHTRITRYAVKHGDVSEEDRKEEIKKLHELVHAYH